MQIIRRAPKKVTQVPMEGELLVLLSETSSFLQNRVLSEVEILLEEAVVPVLSLDTFSP